MMSQPLHQFKAAFFKALAHPTRIRILELLRSGERTVGELQVSLEVEPSSMSQQLAVLRAHNIVTGRRIGTNVAYSVRDPEIFHLLDVARQIFNNHLIDLQEMMASQDSGQGQRTEHDQEIDQSGTTIPASGDDVITRGDLITESSGSN